MDTKTVKNVSGQDLTIIGVGVVKAGETVAVPSDFHNANFEDVKAQETKPEDTKEEDDGEGEGKKGKKIIK